MTLPPGPRMPAPAQILAWGAQPTAFLETCRRRYGDAFTLRLLGFGERGFSDVVVLTEPAAIKALFTVGAEKLTVGELRAPMAPMFGRANTRAGFERGAAGMAAILLAEIARRREDPALTERDDILSLLLQARDEGGAAMSDRELRDELVTLLLAGHETTATALAWTFDELFRHPTALDRLHEEDNDEYLDAVIKEVLRLHPPIAFVDRKLTADLET